MRVPESLVSLVERGVIDSVVRPLMSGKEAEVYLVLAKGRELVAKVYKEADNRSFRQRAEYEEGRRERNTRDQRAMDNRSKHGRELQEASWRSVEATVISCLHNAGVSVPEPVAFVDNVLVMELVTDSHGDPAPRLATLRLEEEQAELMFETLVRDVIKMLCAGWVHGDLSEFNILAGSKGPVIIDFPQAVDSSRNRNAGKLLIRDVTNLTSFFGRFSPMVSTLRYGEQIWALNEQGRLTPDAELSDSFRPPDSETEISSLLAEIVASEQEHRARREALGLPPPRLVRKPQAQAPPQPQHQATRRPEPHQAAGRDPSQRSGTRPGDAGSDSSRTQNPARPQPSTSSAADAAPVAAKRRRRRRRRKPGGGSA